jgi:hypothetical protein
VPAKACGLGTSCHCQTGGVEGRRDMGVHGDDDAYILLDVSCAYIILTHYVYLRLHFHYVYMDLCVCVYRACAYTAARYRCMRLHAAYTYMIYRYTYRLYT